MLGRDRRDERRDERRACGVGGNAVHAQMREKLPPTGDDSWIEDDRGRKAYEVDCTALRVRKVLVLEDASGTGHVEMKDCPKRARDVMQVERAAGRAAATVEKAMTTPWRERFSVDVAPALSVAVCIDQLA